MDDPVRVRFLDRSTPPHVATLVLMAGLAAMNMSAFLPALNEMTAHFGTNYAVMGLSVSLYLAVTAVIQLVIGPVSDRFGRRIVTLSCTAIFVVGVIACIFAPTVTWFLFFRMVSGAVAVGLVLSRAIVRDLYPADQSASMIGYVTMGMALVPMAAPAVGGALAQAFGWQAVFVLLALMGVLIGALCFLDQGETAPPGANASFRQQIAEYPELLTSPRFWGYVLAAAFASGAFFAFLGGAPYVAETIYGLSKFWSGIALGAPAIGYAAGNFISARYSVRYGIDSMILVGCILTVAGLTAALLVDLAGVHTAFAFFGFCTFVGLGNGLVMPNTAAGMLSVRPHLAGTASGLGAAFMIGGGAALSALAGVLLKSYDGALPLIALMTATSALSLLSILYVIRRARSIATASDVPAGTA